MEICCMVFAAVNHQSALAVMGGWLRLVVCAADLVAETGESVVEAPLQRFGVTAGGVESGLLSENLSPWVL
jgi:hypothetical protein